MAYEPVPVTNRSTSSNLAHLASVFYRKSGLSKLYKKFHFDKACQKDMLPKQVGRTIQFYRYNQLTAATTPKTPEGGVGTSEGTSSRTLTATVAQYTNFISTSDLLVDTAIDPIVQSNGDILSYQAGLSVDTITRTVIDAESASTDQTPVDTYFSAADCRAFFALLQGVDVEPLDDGNYLVIAHPYVLYDLVNDPAANGLADIYKRNLDKDTALIKPEDRGLFAYVGGCKIMASTNVLLTAGTPNKWRVYAFGADGVGCVDLEGRGPNRITDPKRQRFNINVIKAAGPTPYDPEGVIGGIVSYNFVFVPVVLDGPAGIGGTFRYKTMDVPSSI